MDVLPRYMVDTVGLFMRCGRRGLYYRSANLSIIFVTKIPTKLINEFYIKHNRLRLKTTNLELKIYKNNDTNRC